ncbi:hypothetical protein [uncultured Campylobacter sp.]|uniref:hypothetical protein n=1 Tax=uncultured Campylobacter sp. TaxID=218934 RepID=UPI002616DD58|nr:hypothetical protein [uncultured Campylobacter sp.]
MLLLKNADLYAPEHVGRSDVLVGGGKILAVSKGLDFRVEGLEIYDLEGKILAPGLIDQHVHITGGGGEAGYHSRTPEITLSQIIHYGTTTLVGALGTDRCTRSLENLYSKAKALEYEGISTFIHTGLMRYLALHLRALSRAIWCSSTRSSAVRSRCATTAAATRPRRSSSRP